MLFLASIAHKRNMSVYIGLNIFMGGGWVIRGEMKMS